MLLQFTLYKWTVENEMKINPRKSMTFSCTRAWVKEPLNYWLQDQDILEASSYK